MPTRFPTNILYTPVDNTFSGVSGLQSINRYKTIIIAYWYHLISFQLQGELGDAVSAYRSALESMFSTPTEELLGPWSHPKPKPVKRKRHYHWPTISEEDVPFEPVAGADDLQHLAEYAEAVKRLYTASK